MTVRTNWVDESFALLNGAATFITSRESSPREHDVQLELPASWKLSISGMRETAPNSFTAPDYDTLVDSPILAGNPVVHEFEVGGRKHYLVNEGETALWDGARAAQDTQTIVEQNLKMWGSLPYDKYVFLNLIVESGGGLEHKNSCTLMTGRYATRTRRGYLGWLALASHEYFHAWNVKRLRPVELGPFDYENEVYTANLWVAEGFTEYYTGVNVRRAGLATTPEYLGVGAPNEMWGASLSAIINSLQTTPGRLTIPLASSSFDAWIKLYRPDENSANTAISYYTKGAVLAWLLDAQIRQSTAGQKTLDDGMRLAWTRYSGTRGYTTPEFRAAMSETAGQDLTSWFHKALETTEELDYSQALNWFGLEFKKADPPKADNRPKAWAGFQTRTANGHLAISVIPRGTPAANSQLAVDDEIIAVDDWRLPPDGLAQRLEQYAPGNTVDLIVIRRDRVIHVPITLGEEPAFKWQVQISAKATDAQKQHLAAWLGPEPAGAHPAIPATASAPAR
jgi:predicted metalloprotease with PDZ domain